MHATWLKWSLSENVLWHCDCLFLHRGSHGGKEYMGNKRSLTNWLKIGQFPQQFTDIWKKWNMSRWNTLFSNIIRNRNFFLYLQENKVCYMNKNTLLKQMLRKQDATWIAIVHLHVSFECMYVRGKSLVLYHSIFQIQGSLQKMVSLSQELNYLSLDLLVMGHACWVHLAFLCTFQIPLEKEWRK